ncbi:carcinine transporter isoform X1 [Schistocerca cancellata]|uniref:carcinine transporter isoform X1 n=3 Tax=Schistocerca TaxID=7008 RepID=UPI0021183B18|nr:carcinine transporter isoform X1 [Schistocerca cancellata]
MAGSAAAGPECAPASATGARRSSADVMDLDEVLPQVGEFGLYQKLLLWLVCLPACIPCGFSAFNQLFMAHVPDHWCRPPVALQELSSHTARALSSPLEGNSNNTFEKCIRFAVNWTELLTQYSPDEIMPNLSWPVEECKDGWEYNTTEISSSVVIDFNLVCHHAIYPTIALSALNMGAPIGVYMFGMINDRVGRRISFFCCLTTMLIGGFMTAAAKDFWTWMTSRIIVGLAVPAIYQIPFIISLELVGPNYRSFVTVMTCMFYTLGLVMLAGVTYLVRDWVHLALATTVPFLLYYVYWFFLPESPRWLLAKGQFEEGSKILHTLARINKKELPSTFTEKLKQRMTLKRSLSEEKRLHETPGVMALCRTPNMRLKTALITLNWFSNELVYVGLSYYGPSLGSNEYTSFLLSSLVEIPSYLACWVVMDHWGRRWPLCISMIVSGVSCIVTVLLPTDAVNTTLALYLISKFAISASFLIIYPFAGELYPTQLRGIGIGTSAYIGGLGLIIIPFITYLGSENLVLPLVIMGAISVIGGLSGLRLPETLHHRLPQTVEEGEEFGKDWSFKDCIRCIPERPSSIATSYEDLEPHETVELPVMPQELVQPPSEATPLERRETRRFSNRTPRLVRQSSVMETPVDSSGVMQMTYWF